MDYPEENTSNNNNNNNNNAPRDHDEYITHCKRCHDVLVEKHVCYLGHVQWRHQWRHKFPNQDLPECKCWCNNCNEYVEEDHSLRYFITFTTKPSSTFAKVQECFQKFLSRHEALGLKYVAFSEEHITSNAHIHAYVESSKTLKMSHFKNYERYGKINKQRCKGTKDECIDYISKENDYESVSYND